MAQFYNCPVEANQYWLAKDLTIRIYNIERKQYPKLTNTEYELKLKKTIKNLYASKKENQSLIDVLKEYYNNLKKKED